MAQNNDYAIESLSLSEEEEQILWDDLRANQTTETRNALIEYYMPLVFQTAERIAVRLPDHVNTEDLIGWGTLGLIDAINRFEPDRGIKFSTYCSTRISGQVLDELRRLDWTPRLVRVRVHQYENACNELRANLGRPPTDEEIAAKLDLSMEQFDDFVKDTRVKNIVSFNNKWDENENEMRQLEMLQDNEATNPLSELQRAEIKEVAMKGLNENQKNVLVMYYYDNLSMKDIGQILDLSESRVCQIHTQVLDFLREKFSERNLTHV